MKDGVTIGEDLYDFTLRGRERANIKALPMSPIVSAIMPRMRNRLVRSVFVPWNSGSG